MRRTLKRTSLNALLWLSLAGFFTASCGRTAVYEEHVQIPGNAWYKDSVVSFEVEISDTSVGYDLMLYLRNNNDYTYSNIYFFRSVASNRGTEFADTSEYLMADPYGKWLGKGAGAIRSHEWPYRESKVFFNQSGTYTFNVQHAMRTDYLEGVESIGLGVFKAENREE
jgi:gliding motility-associated lipoprotein GldH